MAGRRMMNMGLVAMVLLGGVRRDCQLRERQWGVVRNSAHHGGRWSTNRSKTQQKGTWR